MIPNQNRRPWKSLSAGLILLPIAMFYGLLARQTINMPFLDDYTGVLALVNSWTRLGTFHEKVMLVLTAQHNEYKLIVANTLSVIQYLIFGQINFSVLSTIGNALILPLFFVVYLMWRADSRTISEKLVLFIPVSWLLFQFQYYSLLNWPMSSLQHVAVILFALITIYLLSKDQTSAFYWGLLSLAFAIAASGNGFFVVPIGGIMLLQFRRFARLASWIGISIVFLAFYLYKYDFHRSQAHSDGSITSSIYHLSPLYSLSFLGASIARYQDYALSAILGTCLCLIFIYSIVDKFYQRNPAIFYSMTFIIITAIAVSGLRSDLGVSQSLVSRYRMYSNLMLIFVYLYAIGKWHSRLNTRYLRLAAITLVAFFAVGFNAGSDYAGFKLLRIRTDLTVEGMRRWEHGETSITLSPGPVNEDVVIKRQRLNGNYEPEDLFLRESISLHTYSPPPL
ncbi:hypothetical protein [Acidicapsa ligni]|uniref:hypothetical protein n=1 Tax=Acidicapsa ligni TaxID=542300 RepID=UPI0021E06CD4|nr:hypothetical protein [Acidicapsa ligni]